jgi:hypothetical protein
MSLPDPDERLLAAARSGDAEPGDDADDLAIRRLGAVARSLTDDDFSLEAPPPAVWSAIAAAVGADAPGEAEADDAGPIAAPEADAPEPEAGPIAPPGADEPEPEAGPVPPPEPEAGPVAPSEAEAGPVAPPGAEARAAEPVAIGRRRAGAGRAPRPARWLVVAAAAAVVLLAGVAVALVTGGDGGRAGEVVATAVLEPLAPEAAPAAGPAELVESDGGTTLDLAIDAGALPEGGGYYEVWLIDTAVDGMVSLGPLREDGTYDVPAGVDPSRFPIVDVSAEPTDGDPTHSGTSVLRGTLA